MASERIKSPAATPGPRSCPTPGSCRRRGGAPDPPALMRGLNGDEVTAAMVVPDPGSACRGTAPGVRNGEYTWASRARMGCPFSMRSRPRPRLPGPPSCRHRSRTALLITVDVGQTSQIAATPTGRSSPAWRWGGEPRRAGAPWPTSTPWRSTSPASATVQKAPRRSQGHPHERTQVSRVITQQDAGWASPPVVPYVHGRVHPADGAQVRASLNSTPPADVL